MGSTFHCVILFSWPMGVKLPNIQFNSVCSGIYYQFCSFHSIPSQFHNSIRSHIPEILPTTDRVQTVTTTYTERGNGPYSRLFKNNTSLKINSNSIKYSPHLV